jgi:hypothetical protein
MASHELIDTYLARLARRLPADTVDELTDGLIETWHHYLGCGLTRERAAHAAIADFGSADRVADEFVAQAPGRHIARLLLATGPVMGACWGASLITAKVWTWPIPASFGAVYAVVLISVVGILIAAATSRHSYRRARLGVAGALALVVLDVTMIATAVALVPMPVWPMALAIPASVARIGFTLQTMPKVLTG